MKTITDHVKTAYRHLTNREILQSKPNILLGVSEDAKEALKSINVNTIFDLALSKIFENATQILKCSEDPLHIYSKYGVTPGDIIDNSMASSDARILCNKNIEILKGIGDSNGPNLRDTLNIITIRDLALWPPYLAAKDIFDRELNPDIVSGFDPEAPHYLIPEAGEYPTEKVFYQKIIFDRPIDDKIILKPLDGQIDISPSATLDFGFKKPAIGALLTFEQSWYAQGVSLGNLLHSVALAPGESTRIALIDWNRKTRVKAEESISETESLLNEMEHSRSINEITSAVATESQSGYSVSAGAGTAGGGGVGVGGAMSGILMGGAEGVGFGAGIAGSYTSSQGRRDISSNMTQQIMDATQQYANSARNRRATSIREVSQSESEKITTRVITNYNHMHALSIQYYEIIQIYRVSVCTSDAERCLFIPMKLVDFTDESVIFKYRMILAYYAITQRIRRLLLAEDGTVKIGFSSDYNSIKSSIDSF